MPIPVSWIDIYIFFDSSRLALIVMLPFFVNFKAFPIKFIIICLNLLGSLQMVSLILLSNSWISYKPFYLA